jgi:hypothetical protein
VFPFRRSWIAIGVLAAFDAAFLIPAVITFGSTCARTSGSTAERWPRAVPSQNDGLSAVCSQFDPKVNSSRFQNATFTICWH